MTTSSYDLKKRNSNIDFQYFPNDEHLAARRKEPDSEGARPPTVSAASENLLIDGIFIGLKVPAA